MKTKHLFLVFLFYSVSVYSQWSCLSSSHFNLYYPNSFYSQAESLLIRLEYYRPHIETYTGVNLNKLNVVLQDNGLVSGGSYFTFPEKMLLNPIVPSSFDWSGTRDFYTLLAVHELTHQLHLSQTSLNTEWAVSVFGTSFYSNAYIPNWFSEGLAVVVESSIDPYSGRLNDGYFDAVLATVFNTGKVRALSEVSLPYSDYLYGRVPYVYGSSFLSYLEDRYGRESISDFIQLQGTKLKGGLGLIFPGIGFDKFAKTVFGKSFQECYDDWLVVIGQNVSSFKMPDHRLTQSNGTKRFLYRQHDNVYYIYTQFLEPEPNTVIRRFVLKQFNLKANTEDVLVDLGAKVVSPLQLFNKKLYFLMEERSDGFQNYSESGYGVVTKLMEFDLITKRLKEMSRGLIRSFYVKSDNVFFIVKEGQTVGAQSCYILDHGYEWSRGTVDALLSEFVVYGNTVYCIAKKQNRSWNLYQFDENKLTLKTCIETPYPIVNLKLNDDCLTFVSNQKGYYHLYKFNTVSKETVCLSSSDGLLEGLLYKEVLYGTSFFGDGEALFSETTKSEKTRFLQEHPLEELETKEFFSLNKVDPNDLSKDLTPYSKYIPYLVAGKDVLSRVSYSLSYAPSTQLDLNVRVNYFSPFQFGVRANSQFGVGFVDLPLYRSLGYGLTGVTPGLLYNFESGLFLTSTFRGAVPNIQAVVRPGINVTESGASVYSRLFWFGSDHSVTISSTLFSDYPTRSFIRGFENDVYSDESGLVYSIDAKKRLLKIRKANWNPYIGVGDLYGGLFYDYSSMYDDGYAWGYEFQLESIVGMNTDNLKLTPRVGLSSSGGRTVGYFSVDMNLAF